MKELSNRTATFTDSVIRRMTRISNKYGAVNLSQGFPDFDPPAQLLDSLSTIATDPKPLYHQYSITWGSQAMREALAAKPLIINFIRTLPTFIRTCADECGNPIP